MHFLESFKTSPDSIVVTKTITKQFGLAHIIRMRQPSTARISFLSIIITKKKINWCKWIWLAIFCSFDTHTTYSLR